MKKIIAMVTTSVVVLSVLPTLNVSAQNFDTKEVKITQNIQENDDLSYGIIGSEYEKLFDEVVQYVRKNQYNRTSQQEFNQKIDELLSQKPNVMTRSYYSDLRNYINSKWVFPSYQLNFLNIFNNSL